MARARPSATLVALAVALPTLSVLYVIFSSLANPNSETIRHLLRYVLPKVVPNTLVLVAAVATLTTILGTVLAWLTSACEFPGRRFFRWALLLPMALPGYVLAFIFLGVFDYTGPVQSSLRAWLGVTIADGWIRGLPGLVLVLSLTLYPYVYLLARTAFFTLGRNALEAARSLGLQPAAGFVRVALPMARPWILGGTLLVIMETLADFGTVSVFNYDTFTTAIYKSWFGMFSLQGALNLSSILLVIVFAILLIERRFVRARRYAVTDTQPGKRFQLKGAAAFAATAIAGVVFTLGLVLPVGQLLVWSIGPALAEWNFGYLGMAGRSVFLAGTAAAGISLVAIVLAYAVRHRRNTMANIAAKIATLGYALPGTVLAVGVFVPMVALSALLNRIGVSPAGGIVLQGTLAVMLVAYLVRFLAVSYSPVENGLLRITRDYDEAARIFGVRGPRLLTTVHWPMLRSSVLTGALLVFVDVMKEMPITLMTRPLGWETLAVRIFEKTAEGQWQDAAPAALSIVLVGLLPVFLLSRSSDRAIAS